MMNEHAASRLAPQDKLALHPQLGRHLAGQKVYPVGLEISPSGTCQASCDFCFYAGGELGEHRKVFLQKERLFGLFEEMRDLGCKAVTWTGGGEPSLHPAINDLVWACADYDLEQGMFTNALSGPRYEPSLLSWVRVTMTDKPYRVDVIERLRACKTLGFAFNYKGPEDDGYLRATLELAGRVKADYVQVRPALAFHGQTVDIEPPKIDHPLLHVTGYKFEDARVPHGYDRCEGYHFVPFLWEDGNLDVCAYMRRHPGYTLGNIYKDSLKDIMDRAPAFVPVRSRCQVCCKNHEINKLVHRLRGVENGNFP